MSVELPQRLAEPEPPPRPAKAGWRKRLWIYVVTLSAGVAATLAYFDASPESRLAGLLAAVDASAGRKRVFQNDGGYLAVFPQRGYVLTLFVGDSQRFDPVYTSQVAGIAPSGAAGAGYRSKAAIHVRAGIVAMVMMKVKVLLRFHK